MERPQRPDDLAGRLAAGEREAFAELYDRHAQRLWRIARRLVDRPADADDVVHDVFVAAFRSRASLARVVCFEAYLARAARHEAARARRRGRRRERTGIEIEPIAAEAARSELGDDIDDERIARAVSRLPRTQREVLALHLDGGMTFAEVAATLGISPHTAASRYRYALEKLRVSLERITR